MTTKEKIKTLSVDLIKTIAFSCLNYIILLALIALFWALPALIIKIAKINVGSTLESTIMVYVFEIMIIFLLWFAGYTVYYFVERNKRRKRRRRKVEMRRRD